MKGKDLICNKCKGNSFQVTIGSMVSERYKSHRTQLIKFRCIGCGYEYAIQNEVMNTNKRESVENVDKQG